MCWVLQGSGLGGTRVAGSSKYQTWYYETDYTLLLTAQAAGLGVTRGLQVVVSTNN